MLSVRCAVLALFLPLVAHATKPQRAVWEGYADLSAGKCRSTSLTEDGVLSSAPAPRKLADLNAEEAWSVLAMPDGSVIVGTAPEGRLLRVASNGTVRMLARFPESHIYALAAGRHGEIFAATSPNGKIYQVNDAGKMQVFFDPGETYIWSIAVAPDGTLYAGTGTKGRIYRVTARGKGEVWYGSNETHIRSLALDARGDLLAGSAPSGYLYEILGKNQAVVLDDTGHEEVNRLQALPDGTMYFTATGAAKGAGTAGLVPKKAEDSPALSGDTGASSTLYRLSAALDPQQVWNTKDTLLAMTAVGDGLLLGAAADGALYSVVPHGEATRLGRIDSDSVTDMAPSGAGTVLATSDPGRIFLLGSDSAQPGVYETSVVDSGSFAQWGAVAVDASDAGSVKIFTRSGNTALPDKTWYNWAEAAGGEAKSAAARYLQLRLEISRGTVDKITAYFLARNQPPHLDEVRILAEGRGYEPAPTSALPPLPQTAAQLLAGGSAPEPKAALRYVSNDGHGQRTLLWKASDPNGDDLTFDIAWRKKGEGTWHDLAHVTENLLTWDTSSWSDGRYELRVRANDAAANAPGTGLTDEAISREMIVNNTPPVIQTTGGKNGVVEFTVRDELSGLRSVTGSTDGKTYHSLSPMDGILDSGTERFSVPVSSGQTLFIRAEDNSGNVAGAQAK